MTFTNTIVAVLRSYKGSRNGLCRTRQPCATTMSCVMLHSGVVCMMWAGPCHRGTTTSYSRCGSPATRTPRGRHPARPLFGQYALKKRAYCPTMGAFRLRHSYGGSSVLPSSGRVPMFHEPSTKTSNAAILRGRSTMRSMPLQYHAFFQPWLFFSTTTLAPPLLG